MSDARPRTPTRFATEVRARRILLAPLRSWRRSLRLRTVVITLLLSSVALLVVGTVVSYTIAQGLFQDRLQQVLAESARATTEAQVVAESLTTNDQTTLQNARLTAIDAMQTAARPTGIVWTTDSGVSLPAVVSPSGIYGLISDELRSALDEGGVQQWQSTGFRQSSGAVHPAIVVGDAIRFGDGQSDLFFVYDIQDVQDTLSVVQRALVVGGLVLLLLIAAVTVVVTGIVIGPIRQAAAMSERLAAGHLEQRIPEHGQDVAATLARSFNRMAESLQRQITQLANLSRVQQRFVSDVSHELRTPLTTIRLATDVIYDARADASAPAARSAELLKTQVERFETLLADLLEISRMDAHATEISGEPTNLVDLTREMIDSLGGLAAETGITIELVAPGGHVAVDVDSRRIARIVRNLLANALEHGEGRPIVVTIDSSEDAVGLGVRDHGVGMSESDAERVFDRFWRADPSRQRRIGGTGLGLAISLEDAVLHGGALEVWTRKGEGTNFVLTLPRASDVADFGRPVPLRPLDALPATAAPSGRRGRRRPVEVGS